MKTVDEWEELERERAAERLKRMRTAKHTPVLTAEEWEEEDVEQVHPSGAVVYFGVDHHCRLFAIEEEAGREDDPVIGMSDPRKVLGVAAKILIHASGYAEFPEDTTQHWGYFTWEDVHALDLVHANLEKQEGVDHLCAAVHSLRERIAALLPPRVA